MYLTFRRYMIEVCKPEEPTFNFCYTRVKRLAILSPQCHWEQAPALGASKAVPHELLQFAVRLHKSTM